MYIVQINIYFYTLQFTLLIILIQLNSTSNTKLLEKLFEQFNVECVNIHNFIKCR